MKKYYFIILSNLIFYTGYSQCQIPSNKFYLFGETDLATQDLYGESEYIDEKLTKGFIYYSVNNEGESYIEMAMSFPPEDEEDEIFIETFDGTSRDHDLNVLIDDLKEYYDFAYDLPSDYVWHADEDQEIFIGFKFCPDQSQKMSLIIIDMDSYDAMIVFEPVVIEEYQAPSRYQYKEEVFPTYNDFSYLSEEYCFFNIENALNLVSLDGFHVPVILSYDVYEYFFKGLCTGDLNYQKVRQEFQETPWSDLNKGKVYDCGKRVDGYKNSWEIKSLGNGKIEINEGSGYSFFGDEWTYSKETYEMVGNYFTAYKVNQVSKKSITITYIGDSEIIYRCQRK